MGQVWGYLKALTREAELAGRAQLIELDTSPFRVGRESRSQSQERLIDNAAAAERRAIAVKPNNDIYLTETTHEVFISREHFEIIREKNRYVLVDRQSALGTWVEGELVGGNREGGKTEIRDGDVIYIGSYRGGFIYKFLAETD